MEEPPGLAVVLEDVLGGAKTGPDRPARGDHVGTAPGAFRSRSHGRVGLHLMYLPLA
jgi:hypothetical protein